MAGEAEASPATKIWDPGGVSGSVAVLDSDSNQVAAAIRSSGAVRVEKRAHARRSPPRISARDSLRVFGMRERLGSSPVQSEGMPNHSPGLTYLGRDGVRYQLSDSPCSAAVEKETDILELDGSG